MSSNYNSVGSKTAETALSEKESLLATIAAATSSGIYAVNYATDEILFFNEEFCRIWNVEGLAEKMRLGELRDSELLRQCLAIIADVPAFTELLKLLQDANNHARVEGEIVLSTSRLIKLVSTAVLDDKGCYVGRLCLFEDITERRLTEDQMIWQTEFLEELVHKRTIELQEINVQLQSEIMERREAQEVLERYQILAGRAGDIILFVDTEGVIIEANRAAVQSYGYSRRELLKKSVFDLTADREETIRQLAIMDKEAVLYETVHKRSDGTLFDVEVNSQSTLIKGRVIVLSIIRDISERKRMEEKLKHLAHYDYLTDVPNRYHLEKFFASLPAEAAANALLFVDIDNFKTINDRFGHTAGDKLLTNLAMFLKRSIRGSDFLARLGGDEFAIVLPGTSIEGANAVAHNILKLLETETLEIGENLPRINISVSIGISIINNSQDFEHFFVFADRALYAAKEEGKNRAVIVSEASSAANYSRINNMIALITDALKADDFTLVFQPIYKPANRLLHYEALLRLIAGGRIIQPGEFIPIAERFGLMTAIDKWVVKNALKVLLANPAVTVFVNLSGQSLSDSAFLEWIESSVLQSFVEPSRIGFEITETAAIKNLSKAELWIRRLKGLGCKFALDDFGIGFSSFSYLGILPIDYLKIDGSFIRHLDVDPNQKALVKAMNAAAHALGKETIAEYVENESIWIILQQLNVDCGQGYYWGKPGPILSSDNLLPALSG